MEEHEVLVAVVPDTKAEEEQALVYEVTGIERRAESLIIETEEDYVAAGNFGRMLKKKSADVTDFFKPMRESTHKAHKEVCDREKEMLAPLRRAEQMIKTAMSRYVEEAERKRREMEEAARRAAEAERERKIVEAVAFEDAGDQAAAEAAMQDAEIMDTAARNANVPQTKITMKGVSTSKDWEIVSVDSAAVPVDVAGTVIRPVDQAAVMRLIRSSKGTVIIPGITYREVAKMSFRR